MATDAALCQIYLPGSGVQPAPQILNTQLLSQSIFNLLNNAADASLNISR